MNDKERPDGEFGSDLGSKQKQDGHTDGSLQPGPSGHSPDNSSGSQEIGGELGGIGSETPPRGPKAGPRKPNNSDGCFNSLALLLFLAALPALIIWLNG